ncbi:MAG: WG repeat-containing protein [Clostridia bacterium]|nr:WG repeat-containing protein [Clostridia bacterium]
MKKRLIVLFLLVILVVLGFFIKNKIKNRELEYTISNIEVYKYVKYKNGDNFGVIDRNGNIIIEAMYNNIEIPNPEKDIFICYKDEENIEVLNSKKERLFSQYDKVEPIKIKNIASTLCFEKSVLKYKKDGLYGLIDFNGKQITKNEYSLIENLQSTEGKFLVGKNDKFGVINMNGVVLVEPKFDQIETDEYYSEKTNYSEAGFIVSNTTNDGYRYGYIDYNGKNILKAEFNNIIRIKEEKELYLIVSRNGQYGLYKGGKQIIKSDYQSIIYTENGALIIEKNGQFGIANKKGEIKVEPKYAEIEQNGIYLYAQSSRENDVYDSEGNKQDISFSKSVFETENKNYRITTIINNDVTYYGIENNQGLTLVENSYNYIEYAFGEYFIVENKDEKYGVINANGRTFIDTKYDLIQKIRNKNILQISSRKNDKITLYSSKLEEVVSLKSAVIQNEENFVKIHNKKELVLLDKDGNKIDENSEIVQNELKKKLPEKIGNYKKQQITLDDVFYE